MEGKREEKERERGEKVKAHRKRSGDQQPPQHSTRHENLPTPPPDPTLNPANVSPVLPADGATQTTGADSGSPADDFRSGSYQETDPFKRLFTYREREAQFLRLLCEGDSAGRRSQAGPGSEVPARDAPGGIAGGAGKVQPEPGFESATEFLMLLNRAGPSVAAALATKDAIDQLDRLHDLVGQFLTLQEQNMRMQWQLKNVETLRKLKLMQRAIAKDPEAFIAGSSGGLPEDTSDNDLLDNEIEQNLALLETILAAGNSASSKRSSSKRERSKSVINDEIGGFQLHRKESSGGRNYPLRRQSAISDFKPKVSKWTKVKAAFKWEKTSALPSNEIKSSEAMMIPVNNEVARYLRVPSIPCVGSSGDSVFSSSSGIVVSGGSAPGTPGDNSLASSVENLTDVNDPDSATGGVARAGTGKHGKRDSVKSGDRGSTEEDARRSRSLDGEAILEPIRQMDKNKNKSAWSKVKGIVKNHRGSLKSNESSRAVVSKSSNSVGCSREASPCESMDACELAALREQSRDRSDSFSSSQASPGGLRSAAVTPTFLLQPASTGGESSGGGPNSPCAMATGAFSSGEDADWRAASSGSESARPATRSSRKGKHIPEIESVPEGVPIGLGASNNNNINNNNNNSCSSSSSISRLRRKSPPKPLSLSRPPEVTEGSLGVGDGQAGEGMSLSPKRRNCSGSGPAGAPELQEGSLPASPSGRQFGFFGGSPSGPAELQTEMDYSSGDVSDQHTPRRRPSPKGPHTLQRQREEIERRYQELQRKLQREFDAKQQEWERMRPATLLMSSSPLHQLLREDAPGPPKPPPVPLVEDNLTPDFRKKLSEWRSKHQPQSKDGEAKAKKPGTDWQLWKTGQIKLEGQGLRQLPDAKDLPEDFQKKLSEWKQMKAANKVPAYSSQTSQVESSKRQSTPKKSKTSDELDKERSQHQQQQQKQDQPPPPPPQSHKGTVEGLSKLKALVGTSETPKRELVVQTTRGFIRFEGISRKFTRKLFEWEKAKGIGPEASTVALLHPGYAPVVVESRGVLPEAKREKSPALTRSLSMDSVAPNPSASSISHQPSSLSLNDADERKEADGLKDPGGGASSRRVSSNPELELAADEREEPGAVLVEVEDEVLEVAEPLPGPSKARVVSSERERTKETAEYAMARPSSVSSSSSILKDSTRLLVRLSEQTAVDREEVRRLKIVLRALVATLPEFVASGSRDSVAFFAYMKDLALDGLRHLHRFDDGSLGTAAADVLGNVQHVNGLVAELKRSLHAYMRYASGGGGSEAPRNDDDDEDDGLNPPQISITPARGAQATSSIQRPEDSLRSMATISVTPTFVCSAVRVDSMEGGRRAEVPASSESEPAPPTSQSPDSSARRASPDCPRVKLQRNVSNGSRRKARVRRMGSRQSSKTESDSDDSGTGHALEVPRKAKRKTSRAKRPSADSPERPPPQPPPPEEVLYVLKVRPGPQPGESGSEPVLISPQETCVELVEAVAQIEPTVTSVLVPTKRTLFGAPEIPEPESRPVINLPPLPQSPGVQRRGGEQAKAPAKAELSPNIRLMIAKYNQRLTTGEAGGGAGPAGSPHSSGSCSPVAWRSPVLDRRVRKQTEQYQATLRLCKSASAGSLRKPTAPERGAEGTPETTGQLPASPNPVDAVLKSSSTSRIEGTREVPELPADLTGGRGFLACDSLRRRDTLSRLERTREQQQQLQLQQAAEKQKASESESSQAGGAVRKERLYKKRTESPGGGGGSGSTRNEKYARCRSVPNEEAVPSRAALKPPSPRLIARRRLNLSAEPRPEVLSRSAPTTPMAEESRGLVPVPLSQRALKLQRAKEEFLRAVPPDAARSGNRSSQISAASTTSSGTVLLESELMLMKSASAGLIGAGELGTSGGSVVCVGAGVPSSSRHSISTIGGSGVVGGGSMGAVGGSGRFGGLSHLASKLRRVRLRRSSKDLSRMHAIAALCRQSLMVDISGEAGAGTAGRGTAAEQPLKKSGSVQAICNRFRHRTGERSDELKKSRSLGFIEPERSAGVGAGSEGELSVTPGKL